MANARLGWFSPLGVAASIRASARRVGLRVHRFRFSARTASEIPLGGLVLPPSASEWPLGEFVLPPSVSELPLSGLAFGVTASAFRHAPLRSGCWASWFFCLPFRRWPLGELAFGLTTSAFRHAPLRRLPSAGWPSGSRLPLFGMRRFGVALGELVLLPSVSEIAARRVGLRVHGFRFSARTASGIALGGLVLPPSVSEITAGRVGLRIHCFRFSACTDSGVPSAGWFFRLPFRRLPSAGWPSGSLLPLFGTHRFGGALGGLVLPLGGLAFGFTASAFRHAPLRKLPSAGWPSGSPLLLFGTHRSAPPHRRSEDRRSTPTRHLFHFKTLIPTC